MTMKKTFSLVFGLTLLSSLAFAQDDFGVMEKRADPANQTLAEYQVSIIIPSFLWAGNPTSPDFLPAGVFFIINGYIYPKGTIGPNGGINPDGSPEFPDDLLGIWTCRGTLIQPTNAAPTGPGSITTQNFNFSTSSELGQHMLFSEGYELSDIDLPTNRVGYGTGRWAKYDIMRIIQHGRGTNITGGANLDIVVTTSRGPRFKDNAE